MEVLEFIKLYLKDDDFTEVKFFYYFEDDKPVMDFEYSFDGGTPSDFIDNYTNYYNVLDGMMLTDLDSISITHIHCCGFTRANVYMEYTYR